MGELDFGGFWGLRGLCCKSGLVDKRRERIKDETRSIYGMCGEDRYVGKVMVWEWVGRDRLGEGKGWDGKGGRTGLLLYCILYKMDAHHWVPGRR